MERPKEVEMSGQRSDPRDVPRTGPTLPVFVLALLLVATGVAGSGVIVTALLCVAMMAAMMFAMPGGHGHR